MPHAEKHNPAGKIAHKKVNLQLCSVIQFCSFWHVFLSEITQQELGGGGGVRRCISEKTAWEATDTHIFFTRLVTLEAFTNLYKEKADVLIKPFSYQLKKVCKDSVLCLGIQICDIKKTGLYMQI
jgi:hypothetical protein